MLIELHGQSSSIAPRTNLKTLRVVTLLKAEVLPECGHHERTLDEPDKPVSHHDAPEEREEADPTLLYTETFNKGKSWGYPSVHAESRGRRQTSEGCQAHRSECEEHDLRKAFIILLSPYCFPTRLFRFVLLQCAQNVSTHSVSMLHCFHEKALFRPVDDIPDGEDVLCYDVSRELHVEGRGDTDMTRRRKR